MEQVKSFKLGFLKSFKRDNDSIAAYQRAHYWDLTQNKEAMKRLELSKFVSCSKIPYDVETMGDEEMFYGYNEGVALFFEITHSNIEVAENGDTSIPVIVNFVKDNEDITVMDVFEFGLVGTINFLGTVTYENEVGYTRKYNRNKLYNGNKVRGITETIEFIMSVAPVIAGRLAKYEIDEVANISNTIAMSKISFQLRPTYNVFELSENHSVQYKIDLLMRSSNDTTQVERMQTVYDQDYEDYTGPYKFITGGLGFKELSDAKLIRYKYEGSRVDLMADMLDEPPFKNFILQCTNVDDVESDAPVTYLHCIDNVLNVMAATNKYGVYVNLATIDLNTYPIGTPLSISNKHINGNQDEEWEDKMCESINEWINVYTEFMLKFTRLMPYSENVNNHSFEMHTTNVVNNTSVYKIVVLSPDKKKRTTAGHKGGTHASPREHLRIAHKRTYKKSGLTVYFPETIVNPGHLGKIHKEYDATNL